MSKKILGFIAGLIALLAGAIPVFASPTQPGVPTAGSAYSNTYTLNWSWPASVPDAGKTIRNYDVQIANDAGFTGVNGYANTGGGTTGSTPTYSANIQSPCPCSYSLNTTWYLKVRAQDSSGVTGPWSNVGSVLVDTASPSVPASVTASTTSTKPTWTWNASTDNSGGSGLAPYNVQWSTDSTFATGVSSATSSTNSFTHSTALTAGTKYYFRVQSADKAGNTSAWSTAGSVTISSSSTSAPTLTNSAPTNRTSTSVTLNATLVSNGGNTITGNGFEWGKTTSYGTGANTTLATANNSPFTYTVSGLTACTTYNYHAYAGNYTSSPIIAGYSSNSTFTTGGCPTAPSGPTTPLGVSTTSPTTNSKPTWSWAPSTSTTGTITGYNVRWSVDPTFGSTSGSDMTVSFVSQYTHTADLAPGIWYFEAQAVDTSNTTSAWSTAGKVIVSAPTTGSYASVTTGEATNITQTTATLNGTITATGGSPISANWFDFGTGVTTMVKSINSLTGTGSFSAYVSGLDCNTTYQYNASATNSTGDTIGASKTFTTADCDAVSSSDNSNDNNSNDVVGTVSANPVQFQFTKLLRLGSNDAEVAKLQEYLNSQGFIVSASGDGSVGHEITKFGKKTQQALAAFQLAHADKVLAPAGLSKPTGVFGNFTRQFVNTGTAGTAAVKTSVGTLTRTLAKNSKGEDVKFLQQYLKDEGFLTSEPDGNFGPMTKAAVIQFQKAHSAELGGGDGVVGPKTRAYILSHL
jgi:hypothetical protein